MLTLTESNSGTLKIYAETCGNMLIDNPGRAVSLELTPLGINTRFTDSVNMTQHLELATMILDGDVVNVWDSTRWFSANNPCFLVFFAALCHVFEDGMKIYLNPEP